MYKLTFSLLTALVILLATGAPSFAQESTDRTAPVGTPVESGQVRLLAELRPLIADGRVIVTMMPERTDWLKALPEQPVSPDKLAAVPEAGETDGIMCFGDGSCGCSDWDGGYSCTILKWACGQSGGSYEVDQGAPYEVGSCYPPK